MKLRQRVADSRPAGGGGKAIGGASRTKVAPDPGDASSGRFVERFVVPPPPLEGRAGDSHAVHLQQRRPSGDSHADITLAQSSQQPEQRASSPSTRSRISFSPTAPQRKLADKYAPVGAAAAALPTVPSSTAGPSSSSSSFGAGGTASVVARAAPMRGSAAPSLNSRKNVLSKQASKQPPPAAPAAPAAPANNAFSRDRVAMSDDVLPIPPQVSFITSDVKVQSVNSDENER